MIGTIYITGEIGTDTTLLDVIKQVKAQSSSTEFLVKIDSVGGYVDSGEAIYNYLIGLGKPVTTFTTKAYSIASMIFMAGSTRIIPTGAENALMIHLPWMEAAGNHQELTDYLKDLKATEDKLVSFYATALELDKNTVHSLLSNETYLSATQSLEMGFATQLQAPQLAVAKLHNNEEKIEQSLMNKLNAKLDSIMNMLTGKPAIKAELVLQDGTGVSITFPELSGSDVPALEDKATVDGKPAEGDFTMPDNTLFTFKGGVVTDIVAPEVPEGEEPVAADENAAPAEDAPADDKDAIIAELEKKLAELQAKLDEMMSAEQASQMLELLTQSVEKTNDLEAKYVALAKQVGSDYQASTKENKTNVKVTSENLSRAAQILNSKF
jgi:ATP-dependent Clp protease protease subunit